MSILSTLVQQSGLTSKITRRELDPFLRAYANMERTLDIGCSIGPYARYFPNRIALDIEPRANVDVVGDAHDLHMFGDGELDCILCTEVLEHLHTPHQAINEMFRVLRPGGSLVLTTRFIFPLHNTPHDYYRFTRYGLEHLFRDFEILELRDEVPTLRTFAVLYQRVGLQAETLGFKAFNLFWLLLAQVANRVPQVLTTEYGSKRNRRKVPSIMTSGYYLAARKPLTASLR